MWSASKFGPGLIGLGLLWLLANWFSNGSVEKDLSARATAAIPADTLDKPGVAIAGRDATLKGTAFSLAGAAAAVKAIDAAPGVRLVYSEAQPLTALKPYVFKVVRDTGKITLSGSVPDPAVRMKILVGTKAAAGGAEIIDQLSYAAGAPQGFDAMVGFAVGGLANFAKASAVLSDSAYTISGEAASQAGFDAANASVKKLATGMTLAKADIQPSAAQIAEEAAAKEQAAKAAAEATAKEQAAKVAAEAAAKVQAAKVAAEAAAKEQAAKAAADAAATPQTQSVGTVVASTTTTAKVAVASVSSSSEVDNKTCQDLFNTLLSENTIKFQVAKADLDPSSTEFLDVLAKTAQRCPKARIEIRGYTDADGTSEANVKLSSLRAEAVVSYLVSNGIEQGNLTAKGYGEANPVASNDTPEGKAKNRRIEFFVQD